MSELISNASINFKRVSQEGLKEVEVLHDKHSKEINHGNKTIDKSDTELNSHIALLNLDKLLQEQFGPKIDAINARLEQQLLSGEISVNRYHERRLTMDKWLNHSGKKPKKVFTLASVYVGDEKQTQQKLDELGFKYKIVKLKGKDGLLHKHFHLTDDNQRKKWKVLWKDAFCAFAKAINNQEGIKVFDVTVHMDEASPHAHLKILNCGKTEKGRTSYSLNQALSDFNVSVGGKKHLSKSTKKTSKRRISGKATVTETRRILDRFVLKCWNWSANKNDVGLKLKFQHKGEEAKFTNQLTASEYKQYMAEKELISKQYEAVVNRGEKNGSIPNSPLEMVSELVDVSRRASKKAEDAKKEAEDAELKKKAERDKLNSILASKASAEDELRKLRQRLITQRRLRDQREREVKEKQAERDKLIQQNKVLQKSIATSGVRLGQLNDIKRAADNAHVSVHDLVHDRFNLGNKLATYRRALKYCFDVSVAGISYFTGKKTMERNPDLDKWADMLGNNYEVDINNEKQLANPTSMAKLFIKYRDSMIKQFEKVFKSSPFVGEKLSKKTQVDSKSDDKGSSKEQKDDGLEL